MLLATQLKIFFSHVAKRCEIPREKMLAKLALCSSVKEQHYRVAGNLIG